MPLPLVVPSLCMMYDSSLQNPGTAIPPPSPPPLSRPRRFVSGRTARGRRAASTTTSWRRRASSSTRGSSSSRPKRWLSGSEITSPPPWETGCSWVREATGLPGLGCLNDRTVLHAAFLIPTRTGGVDCGLLVEAGTAPSNVFLSRGAWRRCARL